MKNKIFLFACLILMVTALMADVSFISVANEESYNSVKDFTNTYEINLNKHQSKDVVKCQAVRLARNWFITAAHCVKEVCSGDCSFQARLMVGDNYEADFTTTQAKKLSKKIFTFSKTQINSGQTLYDIALIYFDPKETKIIWKDLRRQRYNENVDSFFAMPISEAEFLKRVPSRAAYVRALNGTNLPTILVIDSKKPLVLNRDLSIISIWSGKKELLKSTKAPVFYSAKLSNIITKNFGVIQGISGSGVMTNTGELLGIVSAKADLIRQIGNETDTTPLVYIAPFDNEILEFILQHIPNISYITADDNYVRELTAQERRKLIAIEQLKMNLKEKI